MSYRLRKSHDRGYIDHGWLKTYHTFSFGTYYDSQFMGFRDLRVINDDRVTPGRGFSPHGHKNMEILSLVLEGALAHQDSMGNQSIIHANEIQVMSAGTGVTHSEYNPSQTQLVHFLQIWIMPDTQDIQPHYQQMKSIFATPWQLIASKEGRDGSLQIQQDVEIYTGVLEPRKGVEKRLPSHRYGWLQIIEGQLQINDDVLETGDGVFIDPNTSLKLQSLSPSKILFFDLK